MLKSGEKKKAFLYPDVFSLLFWPMRAVGIQHGAG